MQETEKNGIKEENAESVAKTSGFLQNAWAKLKSIPWERAISWIFAIPWLKIGKWLLFFSKRYLLRVACIVLCLGIALSCFALIISAAVCNKTAGRILTPEELLATGETVDCIVVLGCMVYSDGRLSHMLSDRVETAVGLYHAGIGEHLLMSGDNQDLYYNEVDPMRNAAIEQGVPEAAIETDALGLSTYDSLARISQEYKGRRIVIVTQRYHLFRALYIAEKLGMDAYGVSADLRTYRERVRWEAREVLARCKDVYFVEKRLPAAGMETAPK